MYIIMIAKFQLAVHQLHRTLPSALHVFLDIMSCRFSTDAMSSANYQTFKVDATSINRGFLYINCQMSVPFMYFFETGAIKTNFMLSVSALRGFLSGKFLRWTPPRANFEQFCLRSLKCVSSTQHLPKFRAQWRWNSSWAPHAADASNATHFSWIQPSVL